MRFQFLCFVLVVLVQMLGCAHEPKSELKSLPADVRGGVQSLGILAVEVAPDISVYAPTAGVLSGGGAGMGASMGAELGSGCRAVPCIVVVPALTIIFTATGAVTGAAIAEPKDEVMAAKAAIETAIDEMHSVKLLANRIEELFEHQADAPTIVFHDSEIPRHDSGIDYQGLADFACDAVLEIRFGNLGVRFREVASDPHVVINIGVETRLVHVPDGTVMVNRTFRHDNFCKYPKCSFKAWGEDLLWEGWLYSRPRRYKREGKGWTRIEVDDSHTFFKLAESDATLFREFLNQAYKKLSNDIFNFYRSALKYHL